MEKYAMCHEAKINKNCSVEFNKTKTGELHVKIKTFNNKPVVLKESTLIEVMDALSRYHEEVTNGAVAS